MSGGGGALTVRPGRGGAPLREGARVQARVIGALMMRELHTRFGRRNLGYLWLFIEPLLLGLVMTLLHSAAGGGTLKGGLPVFEFFAVGFAMLFTFRTVVGRAAGAIQANLGLLYHRQVTPLDFFYARLLLEAAAGAFVVAVLVGGSVVAGGGTWPADPLRMAAAFGLLLWLAHGLSLLVAGAKGEWELADRVVQPFLLLQMPLSGAFFLVDWLPPETREWLLWNPVLHCFELLRDGQFGDRAPTTYDLGYVAAWALGLHLLGLAAINVARRRIGLD